jgi:hypothetical protein
MKDGRWHVSASAAPWVNALLEVEGGGLVVIRAPEHAVQALMPVIAQAVEALEREQGEQ